MQYNFYDGKPFLKPVDEALSSGVASYTKDGTVVLKHSTLQKLTGHETVEVPLKRQKSIVFSTFADLNKSLSSLANSPKLSSGKTLRDEFNDEFALYRQKITEAQAAGEWEAKYGTYFYDHFEEVLYVLAPEKWHRLGLVTNTAMLITDEKKKMTWAEIREKLENTVIGVAGASVGGNVVEGWMREARPKHLKIADLDWQEISNLNRLERGSIRYAVADKSQMTDPKNPYELIRCSKLQLAAHEHQLVDPYCQWHLYDDGLDEANIEKFILGDPKTGEPPIDIFVEEVDNLEMKIRIREVCRKHGIPVIMLSDFGHRVLVQVHNYKKDKKASLGYKVPDKKVLNALHGVLSGGGNREDVFEFVRMLCGADFAADEFKDWVEGKGEQPTSSLPQSGSTAQISGGIGGKLLMWFVLGYYFPERFIFDFKARKIEE